MDFNEFHKKLQRMAPEITRALNDEIPLKVESAALRFVDDNFRSQSYEGEAWKASDGTILVKSGTLRRGFESDAGNGQVKITNEVKYAAIHNEGFDGEVNVPEHTRAVFKTSGAHKTKTGKIKVKGFKKMLKLPKRQFAPTTDRPSPTLNKQVDEIIAREIKTILNK
jgi:phage gpG-like protein